MADRDVDDTNEAARDDYEGPWFSPPSVGAVISLTRAVAVWRVIASLFLVTAFVATGYAYVAQSEVEDLEYELDIAYNAHRTTAPSVGGTVLVKEVFPSGLERLFKFTNGSFCSGALWPVTSMNSIHNLESEAEKVECCAAEPQVQVWHQTVMDSDPQDRHRAGMDF